jgi:hypothetical protein
VAPRLRTASPAEADGPFLRERLVAPVSDEWVHGNKWKNSEEASASCPLGLGPQPDLCRIWTRERGNEPADLRVPPRPRRIHGNHRLFMLYLYWRRHLFTDRPPMTNSGRSLTEGSH